MEAPWRIALTEAQVDQYNLRPPPVQQFMAHSGPLPLLSFKNISERLG